MWFVAAVSLARRCGPKGLDLVTIRLRRTLINSTPEVLLIKGGPGKGRDRGGAASRRVSVKSRCWRRFCEDLSPISIYHFQHCHTRTGAASQMVNGCAAHSSPQVHWWGSATHQRGVDLVVISTLLC